MTNTQAPERIWALGEPQDTFGIWDTTEEGNGDVAYIRLDLHIAEVARLREALGKLESFANMAHAALTPLVGKAK